MIENKKSNNENDSQSLEGRKFRFIVSSAEDAARIIRERLGEKAKVVSVKQVNGKGLARFLSSPQLEVIVMVPESEILENEQELKEANHEIEEKKIKIEQKIEKIQTFDLPQKVFETKDQSLSKILDRAGFSFDLIERIKTSLDWDMLKNKSISHGLVEVTEWLRSQYSQIPKIKETLKLAFFGFPGAGTTTAMCKKLANEVFYQNHDVQALKIENENPNPDDALRVYCEALGIPIMRDPVDLDEILDDHPLYLDLPGSVYSEKTEWSSLKTRLDTLKVETRVLVVSATYATDLIKKSYELGDLMKATHLVFTNMDQISNYNQLWPFILKGGLPVMFYSYGQNLASDISQDIVEYMIEKTFPSIVMH